MPALRLAVEMLREPAFPDAEFDQVKQQRMAGIENNRTDPAALAPLALNRAMNPFPRGDVRYVGTIDEQIEDVNQVSLDDVRKFHREFYGASHGEIVVVGQFKEAEVRAAAAELLGAWSVAAPYERIATNYQKTTPVNLKIETPGQTERDLRRGARLRDVRYGSRLSSHGAGQLHVRRIDHGPRAEPDSEPGGSELRRELASVGSGRRERGQF